MHYIRTAYKGKFTTDYRPTNAEGFKIAKQVSKVISEANWGDLKLLVVEGK